MQGSRIRQSISGLAVAAMLAIVAPVALAGDDRKVEVVEDTVISGQLQRAFDGDPAFSGHRIYVETYRGAVQLSGWVLSPEQKRRAEELASTLPGVRSVNNELELDEKSSRTAAAP